MAQKEGDTSDLLKILPRCHGRLIAVGGDVKTWQAHMRGVLAKLVEKAIGEAETLSKNFSETMTKSLKAAEDVDWKRVLTEGGRDRPCRGEGNYRIFGSGRESVKLH